jgi:hypothetical protein
MSALWKCVQQRGEEFTTEYAGRYQNRYGPPLRLESEYIREPFDDDLPFGSDGYAE